MSTTSPPKPWQTSTARTATSTPSTATTGTSLATTSSGTLATTSTATSRLKPWEREASGGRLDETTSSSSLRRPYESNYDSAYSNTPYSASRYGLSYGSRYGGYGGYGSSYGSSYGSGYGGYGGMSSYGSSYGSGYGSGYGGYGSSYGSSYGGYGSSLGGYGSDYGNYGSSYGGYGGYDGGWGSSQYGKYGPPMNGPNGAMGMWRGAADQGFQFVNGFHSVTAGFGRFAGLLDANSQAMHGVLSSVVRLIENGLFLYREIGFALSGFTLIKLLRRLVLKMFGKSYTPNSNTSPSTLEAINEFQKENAGSGGGARFWLAFLVTVVSCAFFGIPILNRALGRWLGPEEDQKSLEDAWGGNRATPVAQVRAMHDYPAQNEQELTLRAGDIINVTQRPFEAWWEGEIQGQPGRLGLFPTNYTQPTDAQQPSETPR